MKMYPQEILLKRAKDWERLKEEIKKYKSGIDTTSKTGIGLMCALSYVEGCMAELEGEECQE